jgi:NADH-quinone oxidoreductase subunit J
MVNLLFFFYSLLLSSVLLMLLSINPVNAVLYLISVFISASIIFILINVDFLGLVFLMVYVGAIAVLFLFIVMMLNIKRIENDNTTYLILGGIFVLILFLQFIYMIINKNLVYIPLNLIIDTNLFFFENSDYADSLNKKYIIQRIGLLLFLKYPLYILVVGLTLLVAMLGSIFLTNSKKGYSMRRQYNQVTRNSYLYIIHIN